MPICSYAPPPIIYLIYPLSLSSISLQNQEFEQVWEQSSPSPSIFSFLFPYTHSIIWRLQMGHFLPCIKTWRPVRLVFTVLLLVSSNQGTYSAEGRSLFKFLEVAKGRGEEVVRMRALIGSRPPRCEGKCTSCGHCEAVQVPVVPQDKNGFRHFFNTITSRGDDSSNYKPMNWKCKCGNMLLNP